MRMDEHAIVIGYGNELRGDDGVGPYVARQLAACGLAGVWVLAVQQLTPELAADLAAQPPRSCGRLVGTLSPRRRLVGLTS